MSNARASSLWPLYLAGFLATYIFSVGNVAAPDMARELRIESALVTMTLGAFAACFAAGLIVAGRLGDRYGRHLLFAGGLVAGVATAAATAVAPSITTLVVARSLQGVASAAVMPQILGTIQATRAGQARMSAIATFSATAGVGTAAGQLIGGGLISADIFGLGWRATFWSVALLQLLALWGARHMPRTRSEDAGQVDLVGSLLAGSSLLLLVIGLTMGPARQWPGWAVALLVLAVVGLACFGVHQVWRERAGLDALMPPSVVRLTPVRLGLWIAFLFFGGFGSFMYDYALLTQTGLRLSAAASGLALGLFVLGFVTVSARMDLVTARLGDRAMEVGALIQGVSLLVTAATVWAAQAYDGSAHLLWWLQLPLIPLGAAQGAIFAPLVSEVMHAVPHRVAGLTGGLISTAQQTALALGVALVGTAYVALAGQIGWAVAFAVTLVGQALLSVAIFVSARALRRATL